MILKFFQKLDDSIAYLFNNTINEKKFLKSYFKKKKIIFVDIGTNVGSYSDLIENNLNIKKGFLIEPSLNACHKLSKRFNSKKFSIHNFAMSDMNKKKRIFYEYKLSSQSSLYKQNDKFKSLKKLKKISLINTITFDEKFKKKEKIDFCKIDVQGEEMNVLRGMRINLGKKNIKLIKIEISFSERYKGSKPNFFEIISYLIKYNYHLISISKIKYKDNRILLMDAYFLLKK